MDIRVSDEYKCVGPNCNDEFLYNRLVEYEKRYLEYNDIEVEYELYIYNYETALLMFDLVELSMNGVIVK